MAAEPSRSAASPESYIGSLISLMSKSEIRYEGILYNINTDESSIGLRNVRSFGTEGRKKDGQQIPASDKIYEYILFRGSDIKDLQVKSSPPVQAMPLHNDPAIIQSHYSRPASSMIPPVGNTTVSDPSSQTAQLGIQRPTFPGSLPLYQPGSLGSWATPPAPPGTSGSGLAMPPMYWQGYYAPPSSGLTHLQPTLIRPPPGLPIPGSMQTLQYPGTNASLPSGPPKQPEFPPTLMPSTGTIPGFMSTTLPSATTLGSASMLVPEASENLLPNKTNVTSAPALSVGAGLPFLTPPSANPESSSSVSHNISSVLSNKAATVPGSMLPYQTASQAVSSSASLSSSTQVETSVPLVTRGQLLHTASSTLPSTQALQAPLQTSHKDGETKSLEAKTKPLLPEPSIRSGAGAEAKEPILPLPMPTAQKTNGAASYNQHYNRGRGRGRANGYPRPVTRFTEEFDFEAMNEKFNKDEVWGHLGKCKTQQNEDDEDDDEYHDLEDDEAEVRKMEIKPVYVKDDFFDSLSCTTLDQGARNGRTRFSEQMKLDTETFGNFPRHHRPMRGGGGRGFRGGGRGRGPYYGRGYAPMGRGRGPPLNRAPPPNRAAYGRD